MNRLARLPLLLLALVLAAPIAASAQEPTVVILVRHAEKVVPDPPDRDPALTEAGHARAGALARALAGAGVDAVITSQWQRTRMTAAPLAQALGLTPEVISTSGAQAQPEAVADAIRARHLGKTVLVVGHSNGIPATIRALGGPELLEICESQYGNLFVLVLRGGAAPPELVHARYGAPDPVPGPECANMMQP